MYNRKRNITLRGVTLLETVICLPIIAIGIGTLVAIVLTGRFFLKQAENKSCAISLATHKVDGCLAKSYSGLEVGTSTGTEGPINGTFFNWAINIAQENEPPLGQALLAGQVRLPYKKIEVIISYVEEDLRGGRQTKEVRLENIVPYPYIHAHSVSLPESPSVSVPYSDPTTAYPIYYSMGNEGLKCHVDYSITKDIMVIYNIAIAVKDETGITAARTIFTGCFLDGKGPDSHHPTVPYLVVTRTPIMSQPLISNALVLKSVAPKEGGHDIEVRWFKDINSGKVTLREAELIIIATEAR